MFYLVNKKDKRPFVWLALIQMVEKILLYLPILIVEQCFVSFICFVSKRIETPVSVSRNLAEIIIQVIQLFFCF